MTLRVETTGETVGEAKWAALRELEKLQPGLDKRSVHFQVLAEGERGLLGVGYVPARVVGVIEESESVPPDEDEQIALVREMLETIAGAIGVECRVTFSEQEDALVALTSGRELGRLIGKHGQTIDAIQYLVNAVVMRAGLKERRPVVVDAAGYRARRRATLDSLALRSARQVLDTGAELELEPMSSVERKIIHLRLQEFEGVETRSEGAEPNRYVVIAPAGSARPGPAAAASAEREGYPA